MLNRNYKNEDLEILIATMNRNDLSFLESIFQQPLADVKVYILIVNQSKTMVLKSDFENIRIINSQDYGLSKSRNLAIENSSKDLCWILDDDCVILPDAVDVIVNAHNRIRSTILTFQTEVIESGQPYWEYPLITQPHTRKTISSVLSPEITFKKGDVGHRLCFDERFGLGAQFQDSENFVFLNDAFSHDLLPHFVNQTIVKHKVLNSSREAISDRLIYARGALAAYLKRNSIFMKWKYAFFLFRKGFIYSPLTLKQKMETFQKGVHDYLKSIN
jgi:glycosyltransferase involved in cell wall biosynthesis